jgi:hypothetical protein
MILKYSPVNDTKINEILNTYKDQPVLDYIKELLNLIEYQRQLILKQENQLIALKHIDAWKHYEKHTDQYDPKTRKYIS